jgi:adenosine kinase
MFSRSLVTTLRAAEKFEPSHLESIKDIVDGVKMYYVGGFFLTHGVESALVLAKKAAESGKVHHRFSNPPAPSFISSVSHFANSLHRSIENIHPILTHL